ncbi:MAG: hypothetical protein QOE65_2451 [Solirubrobacteraceae bacterium]|jgi:hypothetical protein|nr:hypothetical protein [Solirubrobacteraceae bacterium]
MPLRPLLALAGVLPLLALAPAPAGAFQIGMQDDGAFVTAPPAARARALDQAHDIGVTYIRITMVWEGFRNEGWLPYDRAIDDARAHGMSVQLTVTGNPRFTARGLGFVGYLRPSPGRYANWLGAVARHFKGRVDLYSLWNEPNLAEYLSPQLERGRAVGHIIYARLVKAGYAAVKRADPHAKVLIGEAAPSGHPLRFLERAARALPGGLRADGWAQHPYQFVKVPPGRPQTRYSGGISNIDTMNASLRRLARDGVLRTSKGGAVPIYFTEFGYPRPGAYYGFFSEALRARYTVQAFQFAKRKGVKALVWYQLYEQSGHPRPKLWDTGLISPDGVQSLTYRRMLGARASLAGF